MTRVALLLSALWLGCGAVPDASQSSRSALGPCEPPTFSEPDCFLPGGGVTRCPMADDTYWDLRDGVATHWAWIDETRGTTQCICKVQR